MSARTPIIRQVSWLATLPQLAVLGTLATIGYVISGQNGLMGGAAVYLAYSFGSRATILRAHRAGMQLVQQHRFEEAIPRFQESLDFFNRRAWIDKFRSIVMMSSSAFSYREMALANIAFCYGQLGNGEECRRYYQECLKTFPDSGLATTALRMLDAAAPVTNQW